MKYLKLFESFDEFKIRKICKEHDIMDYTINPDGSIDVDDNVFLLDDLKRLPVKFNKINGWFNCSYNKLKSLEGSPLEVSGNFSCHSNELTSFEYSPKIIRGYFNCNSNNIKSFEYFPSHIGLGFLCSVNPIFQVWDLFQDTTKIELLNDFDIFRDEDTDTPIIIMDRLNDFLLTIGRDPVERVYKYKNI